MTKQDDRTNAATFISPTQNFVRQAAARRRRWKIGDSTGASLTGGELLMRTLILRRLLRRHVLSDDEKFVGLLLPPSAPGAVANLALSIDHRVAVNLNYTTSEDVINACLKQCGIRHVLTSQKVIDKLGFRPDAELVMLESLRDKVTLGDKIAGFMGAYLSSARQLERKLKLDQFQPDDLITVIFTSGSTGIPKGVMLSHRNLSSNIGAFNRVLHFRPTDVFVGILPLFHSFGYTVTFWGAMSLDIGVAFHFNPLDARQVGKLCRQFKGTALLSTPTFLRSYIRRIEPDDFQSLEVVVTGAEKLPADVAEGFKKRFGIEPVEGYGTTELAPVACVNVPPGRSTRPNEIDAKPGSVGRPLPGVEAKVLNLETGEPLPANEPGMLWIKGPNVMQGYLNQEELTREVLVDGWYKTGDVGFLDDDGFVHITGRISRFSKIGGEMVPHIPIEEELNRFLEAEAEGLPKVAVTAVPDAKKGERLIVVHTNVPQSSQEMIDALKRAGFATLSLPAYDAFLQVEEIPVLGTGKLDLSSLRTLAEERFAQTK